MHPLGFLHVKCELSTDDTNVKPDSKRTSFLFLDVLLSTLYRQFKIHVMFCKQNFRNSLHNLLFLISENRNKIGLILKILTSSRMDKKARVVINMGQRISFCIMNGYQASLATSDPCLDSEVESKGGKETNYLYKVIVMWKTGRL